MIEIHLMSTKECQTHTVGVHDCQSYQVKSET